MDPLTKLAAHLAAEDKRVRATYEVEGRFALLDLARAFDMFQATYRPKVSDEEPPQRLTLTQLYQHGWTKALSLFIDDSTLIQAPAALWPMTEDDRRWACGVVQHCGRLALAQHFLDCSRYGLMTIEQESDTSLLVRHAATPGAETADKEDQEWLLAEAKRADDGAREALEKVRPRIDREVQAVVRKSHEHFIGYDTTPELDRYFAATAQLSARGMAGRDSFPEHAKFGGHPFKLFTSTVEVLIGWAQKRLACFDAVLKKHPDLNPYNCLTIHAPLDKLEAWLAEQLDVDLSEARLALETVSVGLENRDAHLRAGPYPCHVRVAPRHVIESIGGTLGQPFCFMLRELRHRFPQDWDRAVDARESMFRNELNEFARQVGVATLDQPKKIRLDGRTATDVDAALADTPNGTLGLFQLKWQDLFGSSMTERESRMRNFVQGANSWVTTLERWLSLRTPSSAAHELGFPRETAEKISKVRLFVLGRAYATFSSGGERHAGAAWGSWAQMRRAAATDADAFRKAPLPFIDEQLRTARRLVSPPAESARIRIPLGNLEVSLVAMPDTRPL